MSSKAFITQRKLLSLTQRLGKMMTESEILGHFKKLNLYLDNKVEIKWQDGKIVYIPTKTTEHYKGQK